MSDVDSGDILRVGAGLVYDGLYDVVNVWHLLQESAAGQTWAATIVMVQSWLNSAYATLKTPLNDGIGTGSVAVANLTQATTIGVIPWSPSWAGAESGEPTAAGVCCFVWGRTYKPRVQLRKYFGVFGEVNVSTGSWTGTVQDACQDVMDYAIASRAINLFTKVQAVAYNRLLGTYQVAHSTDVAAEPAYQRRRKRGRGS